MEDLETPAQSPPETENGTAGPEPVVSEAPATSGAEEPAAEEPATEEPAAIEPAPSEFAVEEPAATDPADESGTESAEASVQEFLSAAETEEKAPDVLEDERLRAVLEAVIYVAEEPLAPAQIAAALGQPLSRIEPVLQELIADFEKPQHGIGVREVAGGYKMATKPEHHDAVRNFVKSLKPALKLSLPALETLAVIAYKQPVTGPEIMEIRGVQGAGVLKTLIDRKLIATAGRKNVIGKPILYKTTKEFLIQFGLKDLSELPSLKEFEEIRRLALADSEPSAAAAPPDASTAPASEPLAPPPAEESEGAPPSTAEIAAARDASHDPLPEGAEQVPPGNASPERLEPQESPGQAEPTSAASEEP
jgi:segregation and condensation protein B